MAELFKPDIGDVGGSNMTAYTPPSMDFSGIFNSVARTLDSFERQKETAPKLSESEEKNLILEPYISKVQKIMTSDDLPEIKKYALVNGIRTEVARKYPAYNDVFEKATTTSLNLLDPDGDPVQKEYENISKWGETETGTFARAQAFNSAIDPDGNFDEGLYQSKIRQLYYKDLGETNKLTEQKRRNELYKEGATELYRTEFAPTALNDIRTDIETFSTGVAARTVLDKVKAGKAAQIGSQEAADALLLADEVSMLTKRWDAELTRRKVMAGYSPNDPQFSNEPLLIELKNLEEALRNTGTSVSKVLGSMNEQVSVAYIGNMPNALRLSYEANKSTPPAIANTIAGAILSIPENRASIEEYSKSFVLPTYDFNLSIEGTGQTSSANGLPVGADASIGSVQRQLPEFNPEMVPEVLSMPQESKRQLLKRTSTAILNARIQDLEQAEIQGKELSASYLTISTRLSGDAEVGVTPLDQTKIFFGPKAMGLISQVEKKNPVLGEALYPQVNKAIQTETVRHISYLQAELNRNFPNNPIILQVNDKGMVEIKLDPRAKREDPLFMRLSGLGFESDEEMLENLQTVVAMPPSFLKGLRESVESMNTYLMASGKFPDSLKNSPDFAGTFIREQLQSLPKYGGPTIVSPAAP